MNSAFTRQYRCFHGSIVDLEYILQKFNLLPILIFVNFSLITSLITNKLSLFKISLNVFAEMLFRKNNFTVNCCFTTSILFSRCFYGSSISRVNIHRSVVKYIIRICLIDPGVIFNSRFRSMCFAAFSHFHYSQTSP